MLLQTNSYIVPKDKRVEHARLLRRFRQTLLRLGCDHFEVYEQVGANWNTGETTGRFVQIMRFRDRKHQQSVQAAERTDVQAQAVVAEFCELINFPYQQQQGLFAVGFYTSFLKMPPQRTIPAQESEDAGAASDLDSNATESPEPGSEPADSLPQMPGDGNFLEGELVSADGQATAAQTEMQEEHSFADTQPHEHGSDPEASLDVEDLLSDEAVASVEAGDVDAAINEGHHDDVHHDEPRPA